MSDHSANSTLTDSQHEQLHSSIANLVERLQQGVGDMVRFACA